jgi:hypothetical protein
MLRLQTYEDCDAVIYAYLKKSDMNMKGATPFKSKGIKKVKPNGLASRLASIEFVGGS